MQVTLIGLVCLPVNENMFQTSSDQCWVSYFLKVTCYSYKLIHEKSNLVHLLVTFFPKVTCYSYCYILKVTSYFTDTLLHHLNPDRNHRPNAKH